MREMPPPGFDGAEMRSGLTRSAIQRNQSQQQTNLKNSNNEKDGEDAFDTKVLRAVPFITMHKE
jgi:hypothetical protein